MRIVGGSLRGRRLQSPKGQSIRPTTDRNRETLFNILSHRFGEQLQGRVLDIFAGTGALGLEALSRGAASVVFVEKSSQGAALIQEHIQSFGVEETASLLRRDATRPGKPENGHQFDLVFADPPYGKTLGEKAIAALAQNDWLTPHAIVVLEEKKGALPDDLVGFELQDQRNFGETDIGFYQFVTAR